MTSFRLHAFLLCLLGAGILRGADWPMWRCDAGRTAASDLELPGELHLLWERRYTPREMVWDDPLNQDLMPYDKVFEPVVMGRMMFVAFNDCDKVVALDTDTGREIWAFYTDGPVRFPPVAWKDRVFFCADDGCLYCVDASGGSLLWKFLGGPDSNKILGNQRLISTWPARGGPVLKDGKVFFAASIWPFMGTFIYALDAGTGKVVWVNDRTGSQYILQPHNSPAFAGVAPQGALAAAGNKLMVPGGRSVPACFDLSSGEQLYFHLAKYNQTGGSFVCASGELFFNHYRDQVCSMYDIEKGFSLVPRIGKNPVLAGDVFYISGKTVAAYDAEEMQEKTRWFMAGGIWDRALGFGRRLSLSRQPGVMEKYTYICGLYIEKIFPEWFKRKDREWKESLLWEIEADGAFDLIEAGGCLYAAGPGGITAIRLPRARREKPEVLWKKTVEGEVRRLIAADNKLFAVTLDGRIMAFGGEDAAPVRMTRQVAGPVVGPQAGRKALSILGETGVKDGYALFYGAGDGDLLEALARGSGLRIVAVVPDSARVDSLRRRFDAQGLYGQRIAVLQGNLSTFKAPPYLASLTVVNDPVDKADLGNIVQAMRPYGGKAWLNQPASDRKKIEDALSGADIQGVGVSLAESSLILTRNGPLPGASSWTHQYGSPANTVKSDDRLVELPLGILWFGGSSNLDVLPRHAHGPPEQVIGGRLFIEGLDCLSARDVYTGRVLWKADLPGLNTFGMYYNGSYRDNPTSTAYNQEHIPGANIRGTNFVAAADRVYVIEGGACRVLDAADGKTLGKIPLPSVSGDDKEPQWGYIGVYGNFLIAGAGLVPFSAAYPRDRQLEQQAARLTPNKRESQLALTDYDKSASGSLAVMDRYSGKVLWRIDARHGFLHNAVAVDEGRLYCLDKLPPYIENQLRRRGLSAPLDSYRLLALDLRTGKVIWERSDGIFGSWLGYSKEHDILLQSARPSRDMVSGETGRRMAAFRGADGTLLWDDSLNYSSVPIIHGENIITEDWMFSLLTGEARYREHPLTGEKTKWTWVRYYGCNYPIACENLLTFRSAAAGYYDLLHNSGTGNLGGFKSGCTSNLVAADGVLNAPDYTRTCSCSYQNQTSLALVHTPWADQWTFNDIGLGTQPIKRLGINFGAPGDRLAEDGTLWLVYPGVGSPSPEIPVQVEPGSLKWLSRHSSVIQDEGQGLKWVAASAACGIRKAVVTLAEKSGEARPYTVRLHFAEHEDIPAGGRIFDVAIQGKKVLEDFDIVAQAGKPFRPVVREFGNIMVDRDLEITFKPAGTAAKKEPVICGIEIVAENR